jgi:hypothetical protein
MKALVFVGALVAIIGFWDATYNHYRVTTHFEGMLRDMRKHLLR